MGAAGPACGVRDRSLAVTIKNFYERGGDVAIDIGANFFQMLSTDGEGTINFDDVTSTKRGTAAALASAEVAKQTARRFFIESVNSTNFGVFLLFLKTGFEAVNVGV